MSFTECHVLKHAWRRVSIVSADDGTKVVTIVCSRCGTERIDPINARGVVHRRRYRYAPGYLLPKGSERVSAPEYRLVWLAEELSNIRKAKARKKS